MINKILRVKPLFGLLAFLSLGTLQSVESESIVLHRLFAEEWEARLHNDPLEATLVGVHSEDSRLPDLSFESLERQYQNDRKLLVRLQGVERSALSEQDLVSYDLFEFMVKSRVSRYEFGEFRIPFTNDSGFFSSLLYAFERMPLQSVANFETYMARLEKIPVFMRQNIELMKRGLETNFTMPRIVMPGVERILLGIVQGPVTESPFFTVIDKKLDQLEEGKRLNYRLRCESILKQSVMPSYREVLTFMTEDYAPHTRSSLGARSLPNGAEYYRFLVRYFTTLEMDPEEVHQLGLREVARIRREMDQIVEALKFDGDFPSFLQFLRTDPRFYATSPDQLVKEAAWISKRIDGILPGYFGTLPRMPYGVAPVPEHLAPNYTTGRYSPGVPGGDRGGYYWVNTYALEKRPLYALPALTLHEAMPGHHLQIALAQELSNLPEFRRHFYPNSFGEGWALYSEKLGKEMGVYKTAYEDFGRLTYEMWRAGRLVVDTGIHFMGWTRERAIQLFVENSALSLHNIETEVDRYISWPGQALSYKMGELTIVALRQRAEEVLGEDFDLRSFHDAILKNGGVTMPVLEKEITKYIKRAKTL